MSKCRNRKDYRISSLALPMDLRSSSGAVKSGRIRLALNVVGRNDGQYGRIGGWRRLGGSTDGESFVFAIIGDYGMNNENELNVSNLVKSWSPRFIVTTGDNWYNPLTNTIDDAVGKYYRSFIYPYSGAYPLPVGEVQVTSNAFWPVPGNHDLDVNSGDDYFAYFSTPYPTPGTMQWYSFESGPCEFFCIESSWNTSGVLRADNNDPNGVQGLWLQNALASSTALFKIVVFHHPPWESDSVHYDGVAGMRVAAGWTFADWGADIILNGHGHIFERVVRDGIESLIVGNGGGNLYSFNVPKVSGHVSGYDDKHGAVKATVNANEIRFDSIDVDGAVRDSFSYCRYNNADLHDQLLGVYEPSCP